MTALAQPKEFTKKRPRNVPDYLVYEVLDGKPIYYKGYRDVLNKTKQPADIMGTSSLQWVIISHLLDILYKQLGTENFRIASGEPRLHINNRNNLAGDILIYRKQDLPASQIGSKYANVPALVQIEVDVTADLEQEQEMAYFQKKITTLFDFGTQKVIWIFSATKKVLVATRKDEWLWFDWDKNIELINGLEFNIGEYLAKEGVVVE
jgi:hypothetical protein